ncbi:unnamed protein product [Dibothriocephalus latus]|uniref:Fibronectin type-III domain-containing protein n=1 Tax=Dibothriocephalus latus TaxID=60516 RepID=A0A3P7QX09_DIBLA|nr:unnamed protein product [Dibothriocephalus latus]
MWRLKLDKKAAFIYDVREYFKQIESEEKPPQNLTVLLTDVRSAKLKVGLAEGDTEGAYAYAAVLEPLNEVNTLEYGTQIRKVHSSPNWSPSSLLPSTKYRFHGYACNSGNLRCAAAEPVTFETKEMSKLVGISRGSFSDEVT